MTIAEIHDWFSTGQNYAQGIKLLEHFLPNETLLIQLVQRRSSFAERKLTETLKQLAEKFPLEESESPAEQKPNTAEKKVNHTFGQTDGYPEHLKEIDRLAFLLIKERDIARGPLFTLPEGPALYNAARSVVLKDQKITEYLDQLNYYCRTGQILPGTEPITELRKLAQMMLALKNNPPYISKHKNSKVPAIIEEVNRRKQQLQEVDNFIKANS